MATLVMARLRQALAERKHPPTGQFLTLHGRRLHYRQVGKGPDIVLLHGASGSMTEFDFGLMAGLADRFRVTAFDRPGLGWSDALPPGADGLAAQAHHLAQACKTLEITAPLLVGQSYGGSVALAWALQPAAPRALVLLGAPCMPWPGDLDIWYRLNRPALGRWLMPWLAAAWIWPAYVRASLTGIFAPQPVPQGYADRIGTGLTLRRKTLAANVAQVNGLRAGLVAMQPDYPRLTLPIEALHGLADTVVPFAIHARPFAALAPGCHLTTLPDAGHMPHHSHLAEVLVAIDRAHSRANMEKTGGPHGLAL
jgi:pimeloyl-ACP methyl ester carboxylesterase